MCLERFNYHRTVSNALSYEYRLCSNLRYSFNNVRMRIIKYHFIPLPSAPINFLSPRKIMHQLLSHVNDGIIIFNFSAKLNTDRSSDAGEQVFPLARCTRMSMHGSCVSPKVNTGRSDDRGLYRRDDRHPNSSSAIRSVHLGRITRLREVDYATAWGKAVQRVYRLYTHYIACLR